MLTEEEHQAHLGRIAARKVYWDNIENARLMPTSRTSSATFNYAIRFDGETVAIAVPHHNGMGNSPTSPIAYTLEVLVDKDVYEKLKEGDARLGVSYAGGRTAQQRLLARARLYRMPGVVGQHETGAYAFPWFVLGKRPEQGMMADHINGDGLDNRRANLRWVTHTQNMQNRQGWNKYSKCAGVEFRRDVGKWVAKVSRSFDTRDEAETFSLMIRNAAFGEYARTRMSIEPLPVRMPKPESKPTVIPTPKGIKKPKHSAYWYTCLHEPIQFDDAPKDKKGHAESAESLFEN